MAGTDVPAIDGPAGQERGQEAGDGAVVVAEAQDFVEGDGLFGDDLVALAVAPACRDGRHSGLVRYLGRVSGNQGTVGLGLDEDPGGYAVDQRGIRATGGVAAAAARLGDRVMDGQHRTRRAGRAGGDKRGGFCKKDLAFDRCLSIGRR